MMKTEFFIMELKDTRTLQIELTLPQIYSYKGFKSKIISTAV